MRKLMPVLAATVACAALLTGCTTGATEAKSKNSPAQMPSAESTFPITVKHSQGETTIEKQPQKIVVMDMAALDTLDAIGAGDAVVGVPTKSVPSWLKDKYASLADTGGMKEPDVEAIAKLNPDLVVLGARCADFYQEFKDKFTTVDATNDWKSETYSQDVIDTVKMLGEATGHVEEAKAAGEKITAAIQANQDKAKDKGKAMVVMVNKGEMSVHGINSRWNPIFSVFGFQEAMDATPDEGHKAKTVSAEGIKEANPEYIYVVDRGEAVGEPDPDNPAKKVMDNELINATTAAKNGHIVYLSPQRWYIVMTGANNYVAELEEIADSLK